MNFLIHYKENENREHRSFGTDHFSSPGRGVDRTILVVLQQNLPDPLIRLCNILKIHPHLRLIGSQFST